MGSYLATERSALDVYENHWRKLGYTLVRDPPAEKLPKFLSEIRPDAIATGVWPSLLIEVMQRPTDAAETRVRQIQSLLKGHDDWRLEIIYLAPGAPVLRAVAAKEIRQTLQQARRLADIEPRAGLLLAWSTLEAVARNLEATLASRGLSPRSLIDLLVSNGHLPQSDAKAFLRLGDMRNALSHGQIDEAPDSADLCNLIDRTERLASVPVN